MSTRIPLPGNNIDTLMKGINTGSDLMHKLMLNKYYGQLHPSGDVANALYVEQMRNQYGEDDPHYLEAKRAHDMALSARQSLIDNRDILNQTAGVRYSSPLGKTIAEGKGQGASDILSSHNKGNKRPPAGAVSLEGEQYYDKNGAPVYDENPRTKEEKIAYERAIAKATTDAGVRNQIPYAKNVEITLDSIVPEDLVQFSGPSGQLKLAVESLKAAAGHPSPQFLAYNKALTSAKMGAKQLRQFWKESIQPSAREAIEQLTNPSHWNKSPEVAKQQFEQLRTITKQELGTFNELGTSSIKLNYDKDSGQFYTDNKETHPKKNDTQIQDEQLLKKYSPQLMQINPDYTPDNIKHTAKETGLNIGQVIDQLMARGK